MKVHNVDDFFAAEEESRATTGALRSALGIGVRQFTQEEAEEYLRDAVACPMCGGPISTKGCHSPAPHCRSCAQTLRQAESDRLRGEPPPCRSKTYVKLQKALKREGLLNQAEEVLQ